MASEHADRRAFWILRGGMILSSALVLVGLVLAMVHGRPAPDLVHPHPEPASFADVFRLLGDGRAAGFILLGVLVLVATPLLRLVFAAASFARSKDVFYALWSIAVLALVALGWVLGAAH